MNAYPMYRVWCLSWEDEESCGSDIVTYDIVQHDFTTRQRGTIYVPDTQILTADVAAEAYAEHAHNQRDGWEASWPLVFRVRCPDGSLLDFEVDREHVPAFKARTWTPPKAVRAVGKYV